MSNSFRRKTLVYLGVARQTVIVDHLVRKFAKAPYSFIPHTRSHYDWKPHRVRLAT